MKLFPLLFLYEVLSPSISQSQPPKLAIRGLGIKLWQGGGGLVGSPVWAMQCSGMLASRMGMATQP